MPDIGTYRLGGKLLHLLERGGEQGMDASAACNFEALLHSQLGECGLNQ